MEILYILISYVIGNILMAAIVGKVKGVNLQQVNSGNLGARNAGRTLGKLAFVIVAVGDAFKGAVVVWAGRMLQFPELTIALAGIAVVLGHLYPFWNKGKGGKGVATVVGAMLLFSPFYTMYLIVGFLGGMLVTRSATLSMVVGFTLYGAFISWKLEGGIVLCLALLLVIWKQRKSIIERVMPNVLE